MKKCLYNANNRLKKEYYDIDREFENLCTNFIRKHRKFKLKELQAMMSANVSDCINQEVLGF